MFPPELTTERLLLRQWRADDVDALYEIYAQPEFLAHMPGKNRDETAEQVERFQHGWRDDGYCQWAACEVDTGRLVGRIGIMRHHDWPLSDRPVPEVGWVLHRDYWGRGLATEGGRASVEAWREHLPDEPRLYSFTTPENGRSLGVMRRLGFTERGTAEWHGYHVVWSALDR